MTTTKKPAVLHAIGNAHIDPVWLWRWTEGLESIRASFRSALDRMNEYPDFHFTGSSAAFYAWLKEVDTPMFDQIRERVREGRWEIVGGWWIQPDANIPSGESLVRQGLYGQRFFEREFGVMATVGYNPDTFGHTGILPQILRKSGLTRYIFMRPMQHEKVLPGNVFLWRSADGSEVLTTRIAGSYGTWGDELAAQVQRCHSARPSYLTDYIVFYGVGNHGGGPTIRNIESLHAMMDSVDQPALELSTLDRFFSNMEAEIVEGANVPVVEGDLQHHARGCYTAESEVKRQNRRVEHLLLSAERMASAAWLEAQKPYPAEQLELSWKRVLFNQFHDILAGSSLPEAYQDARDSYGYAATVANDVLHHSMQAISRQIDTRGKGDALVVFNPLPWRVKVPIEVERGSDAVNSADNQALIGQKIQPTTIVGQRRSLFVADLPALGYRLFRQDVERGAADNPLFKSTAAVVPVEQITYTGLLNVTNTSLENDFWLIAIDAHTGLINSLFDKRQNVEIFAKPGNAGLIIEDLSDTWGHDVVSYRNEIGRFSDARIWIDDSGPVRATVAIETRWGDSTLLQRLSIYRELEIIECCITVNWQEQMKMLKLSFPLNLAIPVATYDLSYGSIERPCNGEEEPGQQWLDVTGVTHNADGESITYGVALLNDSKYGYDVDGADMRMSVLRSPIYAWHNPYKPEPERNYQYQDQGLQTLTYRLVPHAGHWQNVDIVRKAWELNVKPLWVNEYEHDGQLPTQVSYLSCEPENVVLTVCKYAEDANALIVRGFESIGKQTTARITMPALELEWETVFAAHEIKSWKVTPGNVTSVEEVDLLERPIAK